MRQTPFSVKITRKTPKKYKDYTQAERANAVALAELHKNNGVASDLTGIPVDTVRYWRNNGKVSTAEVQAASGDLARELECLAWELTGLARDKFEDASLSQVAHALSVSIDKAQLLKGAPTSISSKPVDPDTLRARIRDILLDKAKQEAIEPVQPLAEAGGGSREGRDSDGATDRASTDGDDETGVTSGQLDFEE